MTVDHVGYAVKNLDESRIKFEALGFRFENKIIDTARNLNILFGVNGNERIELLEVLNKNNPSPIDSYLKKIGPTPYHICYKSADIEKDVRELRNDGFIVVVLPQEAIAFGGKKVVFLYEKSIGIIELVEQ